ncbi:MAG: isoprenylcysteine carboxylmethyltransferase family protein [Mangrovibacterium sp.]
MGLLQLGLIIFGGLPVLSTALLGYQLLRNGQGILGKPSISPILFYASKSITGLAIGLIMLTSAFPGFFSLAPWLIQNEIPEVQKLMALIFLLGGNLLLLPAYYSLSIFTRVGLPTSPHILHTEGVYRISRNPMYTSFFFFFAACFLLIPSIVLAVLLIFNLIIHHMIILNEEKFMATEFGEEYLSYKKNTARYL